VVSGKNNKLLAILLSLVVATAVSAAPTMCDCNKNCDCNRNFVTAAVSPASDAHVTYVPETSQITVPSNSHLAAIGKEILKPPADFKDSPPLGAKSLPPVPAALFMVLTGFLCVSLVKDRKVWLAVLVGLLWAGQAGFHVIPQLAAHISKKNIQRKSCFNAATLHQLEESCRLRSDIEGTQYIGLLRHLAGIPAGTISLPLPTFLTSLRAPFLSLRALRSNLNTSREYFVFARTKSNAGSPQFAITHFSSLLNPATICPAPRAEQYICFSPAFIFQQLPRGPPNSA
jgi:hypothetical protein